MKRGRRRGRKKKLGCRRGGLSRKRASFKPTFAPGKGGEKRKEGGISSSIHGGGGGGRFGKGVGLTLLSLWGKKKGKEKKGRNHQIAPLPWEEKKRGETLAKGGGDVGASPNHSKRGKRKRKGGSSSRLLWGGWEKGEEMPPERRVMDCAGPSAATGEGERKLRWRHMHFSIRKEKEKGGVRE